MGLNRTVIKRHLDNNSGFTLLEVLIAGAVGMVVCWGIMSMIVNQSKSQRAVELRTDLDQVGQVASFSLNAPGMCKLTQIVTGPMVPPTFPMPPAAAYPSFAKLDIYSPNSVPPTMTLTQGAPVPGNPQLVITSIDFNPTAVQPVCDSPTFPTTCMAELHIHAARAGAGLGNFGAPIETRIPLALIISKFGKITDCGVASGGNFQRLFPRGIYSFTVPAGVSAIYVTVIGAGGGGGYGNCGAGKISGGGGGQGGYIEAGIPVTGGQVFPGIVVGAGGAGATVASTPGLPGGKSSFGGIQQLWAMGGAGGVGDHNGISTDTGCPPNPYGQRGGGGSHQNGGGAGGGTGSNSILFPTTLVIANHAGAPGSFGCRFGGGFGGGAGDNGIGVCDGCGGYGGASQDFVVNNGVSAGSNGAAPGNGGGGGAENGSCNPGGNGADGMVIVQW